MSWGRMSWGRSPETVHEGGNAIPSVGHFRQLCVLADTTQNSRLYRGNYRMHLIYGIRSKSFSFSGCQGISGRHLEIIPCRPTETFAILPPTVCRGRLRTLIDCRSVRWGPYFICGAVSTVLAAILAEGGSMVDARQALMKLPRASAEHAPAMKLTNREWALAESEAVSDHPLGHHVGQLL
jgi:hypothetical protein